jgi:hypothetical protein
VKAAENKAAKEAKEAKKQRKAVEVEAAKEKLAEIEANESFAQMQEQQKRIRRRSNVKFSASGERGNGGESDNTDGESDDHDDKNESGGEPDDLGKKRGAKVGFGSSISKETHLLLPAAQHPHPEPPSSTALLPPP